MPERDMLLDDLKKGDENAFQKLFYLYYKDLVTYSFSFLGNRQESEDVVQEFFVNFWHKKKYLSVDSSLEAYLYFSVRNASLNVIRSHNAKSNVVTDSSLIRDIDFKQDQDEEFDFAEIYKIIGKLPQARRRIFTLCCLDNMKYREVADLLNISINTVKVQMGRALKFIRENL